MSTEQQEVILKARMRTSFQTAGKNTTVLVCYLLNPIKHLNNTDVI